MKICWLVKITNIFTSVVYLILVAINGFTDGIDGRAQKGSLDGLTVDVQGTVITASLTDSGGGMLTKCKTLEKYLKLHLKMKCSNCVHISPGSGPPA